MWQDILQEYGKLQEARNANEIFENYISEDQVQRLEDSFKDLAATQEGQKEILRQASRGEWDAVMYLYQRYLKLILKIFWKYYIGPNRELGMQKIYNDDATEVATKALELLAGLNTPNPYETWKPEIYTENDKIDLIKQFSYWYSRYLQNEIMKILHKEKALGGVVGAKPDDDIFLKSLDTYNPDRNADIEDEGIEEDFEAVTDSVDTEEISSQEEHPDTVESFESNSDIKAVLVDFMKYLKSLKNLNYYKVFMLKLQGLSLKEIGAEVGSSIQNTSIMWQIIKRWFIERYPEAKSMLR